MQRFLTTLLIFGVLVPISAAVGHWALRAVAQHRTELAQDAVYIWGDSRTFRGIDIPAVSVATDKPVISWAQNGAGVYDLLVFAERVPPNSHAIIGVGLHMLEREEETGYQYTELSIPALATVVREGGHSASDLWMILKRGRDPFVRYAHQQSPPHPVRDEVERTGAEQYRSRFATPLPPERYLAKLRIFVGAVKQLLEKGVRVTVVDVPTHETIAAARRTSVYASLGETLERELEPRAVVMTAIEIPPEPNHFYDLSHLNARGQKYLTNRLATSLRLADSGRAL